MRLNYLCLKIVRSMSWPLILLLIAFLVTGYGISGRFGLGRWVDEKTALALHKMLHAPLIVVVLAHALPAMYLVWLRWKIRRLHRKASS